MNFSIWLTEAVKRAPLLSADDEQLLARKIEAGQRAAVLLTEAPLHPRAVPRLLRLARLDRGPDSRRAVDWLRAIEAEGRRARERFIEANLRLAASIAGLYRRSAMPTEDLFSFGVRGLEQAVERFEWRRGLKFSTYATWWVRQAIERGIANEEHLIRLPVHAREDVFILQRTARELACALGRDPTPEEIAETLATVARRDRPRFSAGGVRALLDAHTRAAQCRSLDEPMMHNGRESDLGRVLGDTLSDPSASNAFDAIEAAMSIEPVMGVLSDIERQVITLRFGLDGAGERTLAEVGRMLGRTRERVRQIETIALGAMREVAEGGQRSSKPLQASKPLQDTRSWLPSRQTKPRVSAVEFAAWQRTRTGDGAA